MGDSGTIRYQRPSQGKHEVRLEHAGYTQYPAMIILNQEPIMITADHPGNRKWIDSIVELWPSVAHIIGERMGWDESND